MNRANDTVFTAALRFLLEVAYVVIIWKSFGWGYGLSAAVVVGATGVSGDKRMIIVPVPGWTRVLIEVLVAVTGIIGSFSVLSRTWAVLLLIVTVVYHVMAVRRFSSLIRR